jgi:arylsulfatase A-like enzyme
MGLAHGGLRQKNFNVYEESLRVPLIYSNPRLWPEPAESSALVSHADLLPTLASLSAAPEHARADWEGVDYSSLVLGTSTSPLQSYTVFTYDDWQSGQARGPYPTPPNHIVSIRERRWKLAEYYDADGRVASQWEMYDLKTDPLETRNLAFTGVDRTKEQQRQFVRLKRELARVKATRLQPLP